MFRINAHRSSSTTNDMRRRASTLAKSVAALALVAPLALGLTPLATAADKHAHQHAHAPRHGGIVVEVKDIDYELVATRTALQLYLRDHGKAVDIGQASAKLTLLSGSRKSEVILKPAGDKLEATGNFDIESGTKVIATVSSGGQKPVSLRFALK